MSTNHYKILQDLFGNKMDLSLPKHIFSYYTPSNYKCIILKVVIPTELLHTIKCLSYE